MLVDEPKFVRVSNHYNQTGGGGGGGIVPASEVSSIVGICSASISGSSLSKGTECTIAASTSSPSSVRSFMLKVDGCLIVLMIRWCSSLGCVLWPGSCWLL